MKTKNKTTQPPEPAIAVESVLAPVFVYEFLYNSDCCEGAASTISIHKTKKGAEMAMEFHRVEYQKENGIDNYTGWTIYEFKIN